MNVRRFNTPGAAPVDKGFKCPLCGGLFTPTQAVGLLPWKATDDPHIVEALVTHWGCILDKRKQLETNGLHIEVEKT